jgi:mxaA protein
MPMRLPPISTARFALVALLALACASLVRAADSDAATLQSRTVEPRAFGYRLGEVVEREVIVDTPARLKLIEDSLPTLGPQGPVLELRSMERTTQPTATGQRLSLRLRYQVFAAPVAVRSYELPKLLLRFEGTPRNEELRIETWPLVVAALAAEEASARDGLGELRPDIAPPLRDTAFERHVLWACAALGTLLGGYLMWLYFGLPWRGRQHRPFTQAFRVIRGHGASDWPQACRALHAAFDQTAGRTVFADSVEAFVAQAPRFAALKEDIQSFFARSQAAFFIDAPPEPALHREWLLRFARACRDAERGTA